MATDNRPAEALVTELQRRVADEVRQRLTAKNAMFRVEINRTRDEAFIEFLLEATSPDLRFSITIVDDSFHVSANEATTFGYLEEVGFEEWLADNLDMMERILSHDLRIRLRKTLFGRTTGAIWISAGTRSHWSGDSAACRGKGVEYIFPLPWFRTHA